MRIRIEYGLEGGGDSKAMELYAASASPPSSAFTPSCVLFSFGGKCSPQGAINARRQAARRAHGTKCSLASRIGARREAG
jgi:hypothetical protein